MSESVLLQYPWLGGLLVVVVHGALFCFGRAVHSLDAATSRHFAVDRVETDLYTESDPHKRRRMVLVTLGRLLAAGLLVCCFACLVRRGAGDVLGLGRSSLYDFVLGCALLPPLAFLVRLAPRLLLLRLAARSLGVSGQVRYAQWVLLRNAAAEMAATGLVFATPLLFGAQPFFIGGVLMCGLVSLKLYRQSVRLRRLAGDARAPLVPPAPPPAAPPRDEPPTPDRGQ